MVGKNQSYSYGLGFVLFVVVVLLVLVLFPSSKSLSDCVYSSMVENSANYYVVGEVISTESDDDWVVRTVRLCGQGGLYSEVDVYTPVKLGLVRIHRTTNETPTGLLGIQGRSESPGVLDDSLAFNSWVAVKVAPQPAETDLLAEFAGLDGFDCDKTLICSGRKLFIETLKYKELPLRLLDSPYSLVAKYRYLLGKRVVYSEDFYLIDGQNQFQELIDVGLL